MNSVFIRCSCERTVLISKMTWEVGQQPFEKRSVISGQTCPFDLQQGCGNDVIPGNFMTKGLPQVSQNRLGQVWRFIFLGVPSFQRSIFLLRKPSKDPGETDPNFRKDRWLERMESGSNPSEFRIFPVASRGACESRGLGKPKKKQWDPDAVCLVHGGNPNFILVLELKWVGKMEISCFSPFFFGAPKPNLRWLGHCFGVPSPKAQSKTVAAGLLLPEQLKVLA